MKNPNDNFIVDRVKSIGYAFKGLWILVSTENSIKAQISVGLIMTILGFVMEISAVEWAIQLLTIGLVLVAEALNTGIEKIANFVQPNFDKEIGVIKDISAGAVAFAALLSLAIGLIIYLPKFIA
jgi:diacylglycerol kinase (ATP)